MNSIAYPYLPEGKTIKYVGGDNTFMQAAKEYAKEHLTDRQHHRRSGSEGRAEIIGRGANQVPLKHPKLKDLHKKGWCVRKICKVKSGEKILDASWTLSPSDHGEQQAVCYVMKHEKGAKMLICICGDIGGVASRAGTR